MRNDDEGYRTIIGSCSAGPRLISDRPDPQGWESFARREPKPARERLGPLHHHHPVAATEG
jgi:hypothetical protein